MHHVIWWIPVIPLHVRTHTLNSSTGEENSDSDSDAIL